MRDCYFSIQGWMIEDLGLYGDELIVYALIHTASQGVFHANFTLDYIDMWIQKDHQSFKILESLSRKGLIDIVLNKEELSIKTLI